MPPHRAAPADGVLHLRCGQRSAGSCASSACPPGRWSGRLGFSKQSRYVVRRLSPAREIKLREILEILDAVEVSPATFFAAAFPSEPGAVPRPNDHLCEVLAALPPPPELEGTRAVPGQEHHELSQRKEEPHA